MFFRGNERVYTTIIVIARSLWKPNYKTFSLTFYGNRNREKKRDKERRKGARKRDGEAI